MTFRGRILLKAISITLFSFVVGLFAWIAIASYGHWSQEMFWMTLGFGLLVSLSLLMMVNNSFASLIVNEQAFVIKRWTGTRRIEWSNVKAVEFWVVIQHAYGGTAREPFLRLVGESKRTLYLMKSTFANDAFSCVVEAAGKHGIPVSNPYAKKS